MPEAHKSIREIHHIGGDTPERLVAAGLCPSLGRRGFEIVGISDAGRGYTMARPRPRQAHVLACFEGEGRAWVAGGWQPCGAGTAYLTPPGEPMGFHTLDEQRWQFAWCYFAEDEPAPVEAPCLVEADARQLAWAVEGLHREVTGDASAEVVELWAELVRVHVLRIVQPQAARDPLWRLWAHVDAHLAEPWTVRRLADRSGYEPEALRRLCARHLGRSPMRQVTLLRMRRAEALLRSTPSKLYAVARAVGYTNVFAFSTAFKRHTGIAPAAWRR